MEFLEDFPLLKIRDTRIFFRQYFFGIFLPGFFVARESAFGVLKCHPHIARRRVLAVARVFEPLLAIDLAIFALITGRPGLGAAALEIIVEAQTRLGMDHVQHDMNVRVLFIVVAMNTA